MTVRAAIVGPTGYAGYHLIDLLLRHPAVELTYLASHREQLPDMTVEFPKLLGRLAEDVAVCRPIDAEAIAQVADVALLALPSRAAMAHVPALLDAGLRVVDLSADYRLIDPDLYERAYHHAHEDTTNLADAVYGLPELNRADIPGAMLVANPGCYPTAAALAVAPLVARSLVRRDRIIINAASGTTGAGRKAQPHLHHPEHHGAFTAYGTIGAHRHQHEIEQTLAQVAGENVNTLFVPHLLPTDFGILQTVYLDPADEDVSEQDLFDAFAAAYADEPFVRVRPELPNIKHVVGTNYCDLTVRLVGPSDAPTVVVFSAIDNILKGASGQAVQNMNLLFELDETAGLR